MYEYENKDYSEKGYEPYGKREDEERYGALDHYEDKDFFGTNPAQGESHV